MGDEASGILGDAYRQAIAAHLPPVEPRRVADALLHWRLSLDLNSALFIGTALVLRQARVNRGGALVDRALVAVRLGGEGGLSWRLAGRIPARTFAGGDALDAWLERQAADEPDARTSPEDGLLLPGNLWPAIGAATADRARHAVALDLLPAHARWKGQVEELCRHTARRIAREARVILLGDPNQDRTRWERREDEEDPFIRRFVTAAAVMAFAVLRGRVRRAVEALARLLDAEVVAALACLPAPLMTDYTFYAARGRAVTRQRRLQALAVYPSLGPALAGRPELAAAIDDGAALNTALRRGFGCKPRALKSLLHLPPALLGDGPLPEAADLLAGLSAAPPAWHPRDAAGWRAFRRLLDIPRHVGAVTWDLGRMRELGPDWSAALARIGTFQCLEDIRDFRRALLTHVIEVPLAATVPDWDRNAALPRTLAVIGEVLAALLDARPLLRQLGASDQWHRRQGDLAQVLGVEAGWNRQLFWSPLTDPWFGRDGVVVVPLVSSATLREEGRTMAHCVGAGSYDEACCRSGHHIVSIRDGADVRLSTAELGLAEDGAIAVLQHRGPGNAPPSVAAGQTLADYVAGIAAGDIPCDREALAEDLARRRQSRQRHRGAGFDCSDPQALAAVWAFYRPLLPHPWRRMTVGAFHTASGLAAAAQAETAVPADERPHARIVPDATTWLLPPPWEGLPQTEDLWRRLLGVRAGASLLDMEDAFRSMPFADYRPVAAPAPPDAEPERPAGADNDMGDILASIRRILDEE